ncbi:ATP-binding protein [Streptomyces sp. NPDC001820]|uniref:ATP-binding protein n=1 Tax=Streptomyces sp. NPDC001820 TaxID=3364613 RepID=UPI003680FC1A
MKPFTASMPDTTAGLPLQAGLGAAPHEAPHKRSWLLPPDPSSVPEARRLARQQLTDWALDEQIEDTELLVSEVVTNALRHAWGPIRLTFCLSSRHGGLRCEIEDANPAEPLGRHADEHDEEGRGLHMLNLLTRCWGSDHTHAGKVVWFELRACAGPA